MEVSVLKLLGLGLVAAAALAAVAGAWLNARDRAQAARVWTALTAASDRDAPRYDPSMVADLPEVAQRYFARAIAPGTPLHARVQLEMAGTFVLNGTELPMRARQILAPPGRGFVWQAEIGSGLMRFAGSDGHLVGPDGPESWTKFWLHGLIPLARIGGTADHARAAATRTMLESVWAPATLLPAAGADWQQTGPDQALINWRDLPDLPPMHLTLTAEGDLAEVWAMRWTDANPDRIWRLQPFGGRMLAMGRYQGFLIPTEVELGNHWGTPDHARFFMARILQADFR